MAGELKSDFISGAFSLLRISGLTVSPSSEDNELAMATLEDLAEELKERGICIEYYFEDQPNLATPHNVHRKYWRSIKAVLASQLCSNFGKVLPLSLIGAVAAASAFLYAATAKTREVQYPARHPRGSGSTLRYSRFQRYFRPQTQVPLTCKSITMYVDNIDDFIEHFDSFLQLSETISSYTIEADTGLVVTTSTINGSDITYTIRADGSSELGSDSFLQVKIVVTTSSGRIETRFINFELLDSEL